MCRVSNIRPAVRILFRVPGTRAEVTSTRFLFIQTIHSIVPIREMISRNSVYHYHELTIFSFWIFSNGMKVHWLEKQR